MPTYDYLITGITCANCTNAIENRLRQFEKINFKKIQSSVVSESVSVSFDDEKLDSISLQNEIAEYISEIGYPAEIISNAMTDETKPSQNPHEKILNNKKKLIRKYWLKGIIGILSGIVVMAFSMFGLGLPMIIMYLIAICSSLLTFYLGFESYKKVFYSFKSKEFNSMDLLFSISTSLTIILSLAAFAVPFLPMMFDAPILIYAFRHIGKAIQAKAKKTEFEQTSFRNRAAQHLKIVGDNNKVSQVPICTVKPGDIIIVRSNEIIPLDGICLTEEAYIFTTIKDGATEPQKIIQGSELLAGMQVSMDTSLIKIKVTKTEKDSNLAAMENSLQDNQDKKAKIQETAENILKYFVPTILTLAACFGIALSFFFPPIAAIQCAISILTAVCPCTFGLVTPLAISMAKSKAVENGFQFTSGNALQKSTGIDAVVFDLNGTLTIGKCTVDRNTTTIPKEMMPYLQALESSKRNHLIGRALYHYAKSNADSKDELVCTYTEKYPRAISGVIDGHDYTIGNAKQMRESGFNIQPFDHEVKKIDAQHIVYFAKDTEIIGYAALEDPLRPEAKEVIRQLEQMGKTVYICTGSGKDTALKYQEKLGVTKIFYDCLPGSKNEDEKANTKTNHILKLKNDGYQVAMIGDGGNDALAIKASDFGIAIKSAASDPTTRSLSDAIIHEGSLWPIITAFYIAKDAITNIKQNLLISLSYNLISVVVISVLFSTIGFAINPAFGALLMILQTGFILANAERFKRKPVLKPPNNQVNSNKISFTSSYQKMMSGKLHHDQSPIIHATFETTNTTKSIFHPPYFSNPVIEESEKNSLKNNSLIP